MIRILTVRVWGSRGISGAAWSGIVLNMIFFLEKGEEIFGRLRSPRGPILTFSVSNPYSGIFHPSKLRVPFFENKKRRDTQTQVAYDYHVCTHGFSCRCPPPHLGFVLTSWIEMPMSMPMESRRAGEGARYVPYARFSVGYVCRWVTLFNSIGLYSGFRQKYDDAVCRVGSNLCCGTLCHPRVVRPDGVFCAVF